MKIEVKASPKLNRVIEKSTYQTARSHYSAWRHNTLESKMYIAVLFALVKGFCPKCNESMILTFSASKSPHRATLDHTIPLSMTVKHSKIGLTIMCYKCNHDKGASLPKLDGFNFMDIAKVV